MRAPEMMSSSYFETAHLPFSKLHPPPYPQVTSLPHSEEFSPPHPDVKSPPHPEVSFLPKPSAYLKLVPSPYPATMSPPHPEATSSLYPEAAPLHYQEMRSPTQPDMGFLLRPEAISPPHPEMTSQLYAEPAPQPYSRKLSPPHQKVKSSPDPRIKPLLYPRMRIPPYPEVGTHAKTMSPSYPEEPLPIYQVEASSSEMASLAHHKKPYPYSSAAKQKLDQAHPYFDTIPDFQSEVLGQKYKGACLPGWTHYQYLSSCYQFFPKMKKTWIEAEMQCQQIEPRSHLSSIHGNKHNQFIQNLIKADDPSQPKTWIGLSDCYQEGLFLWSDGSPTDFTKWKKGQPDNMEENENCVHINRGDPAQDCDN
ncbi:hypothetical protein scyTo_0019611 [Scyliorhinus torazame]|uniref:C-type lectin domain-containing protein n=1 Tax=Scyliorhinus torazame TaxID=75743 RepID=A0A401Q343_SCYTO|nr:hypothetical protein [Scyliorhinus torazame]